MMTDGDLAAVDDERPSCEDRVLSLIVEREIRFHHSLEEEEEEEEQQQQASKVDDECCLDLAVVLVLVLVLVPDRMFPL